MGVYIEKYGTNNVTWDSVSIDDIIDMSSKITDFSLEQVAGLTQKFGWSVEPLGKGSLKGIPYEQGGIHTNTIQVEVIVEKCLIIRFHREQMVHEDFLLMDGGW
ncbi:MAG: hypothetical protein K5851_04875 [Lachnospiraceae bacterium]|nr:hypothetical protein [Lachnospiraceae bacterium]